MKNSVFAQIEESVRSGKHAMVLEWNTNDRQHLLEEKIYPSSLHMALATYLGRKGFHCGLYSQGIGLQPMIPGGSAAHGSNPFHQGTVQTLNVLTSVLRRTDTKVALIVQYSDLLAPATDTSVLLQPDQQVVLETLHRWGADDAIRQAGNIVILISYEGGVNSLLTKSGVYRTIQVPLPDESSRKEFINLLLGIETRGVRKYGELEDGLAVDEMARLSNGIRLIDLETIFAAKSGARVTRSDVQAAKATTIREMAGELVEIVDPREGFEAIAGLPAVKDYFQFLKWMFQNGSPAVPYAMILAGVPGTGKSKLCSTLAKELNLPLLILRNLYGPFLGQSEQNLERVLGVVNSLSPCVIVIEEIDQGIGQRGTGSSGDSGTSNRMSQRFWEALGSNSNRGKNLWIGTSNRPDLLDAAMLDRFQVVIPFLHPTPSEVLALIPTLARQLKRDLADDVNVQRVCRMPNLYLPTVRCLTEIVMSAAQRADYQTSNVGSTIRQEHLMSAAQDYKITYDPIQHEYIALKSIEMVSFSSLLPWMSLNGRRAGAELPAYLQGLVDETTGMVDVAGLARRIRELEQEIYTRKMSR